jgi:RimJ/RimL family protein N-acetyltransferase
MNEPAIPRNTLTIPYPYDMKDARMFYARVTDWQQLNNLQKDWSIRQGDLLIGGIGLMYNHGLDSHKSEIGYWLSASHRNKGIMTDCIRAFSQAVFDNTSIVRLEAHVFSHNEPSCRALEKAGYEREGYVRKGFLKNGKYLDAWLYSRLAFSS